MIYLPYRECPEQSWLNFIPSHALSYCFHGNRIFTSFLTQGTHSVYSFRTDFYVKFDLLLTILAFLSHF